MYHKLVAHAATSGCIECKTRKLLNARAEGKSPAAAQYLNESLWPSHAALDAYDRVERRVREQRSPAVGYKV